MTELNVETWFYRYIILFVLINYLLVLEACKDPLWVGQTENNVGPRPAANPVSVQG